MDVCIDKLIKSDADSLRIVTPAPCTPYKMWTVNDDNELMQPLLTLPDVKEPYNEPRQRLPKVYWQVGILDVIKTGTILEKKSLSGDLVLSHIVPYERSIDIDDINSFTRAAEVMAKNDCVKFDSK